MTSSLLSHLRASAFICGSLLLLGCETTDGPSEARKGQDAALKDPFAVGPDAKSLQRPDEDDKVDRTDISGGSTSELNKQALKRDWNAVWGN